MESPDSYAGQIYLIPSSYMVPILIRARIQMLCSYQNLIPSLIPFKNSVALSGEKDLSATEWNKSSSSSSTGGRGMERSSTNPMCW